MHELKLYEVQKKYKDKTAVKQVSYTFKHGVYGLLGENGAGKTWKRLCVKCHGIDHKRDKCPSFFRVPTPITAPRHIRPHCAHKDAYSQQKHSRDKQHLPHHIQPLHLLGIASQRQCHHSVEHQECQQGIRHHNHRHMDRKQWRLQYWHKRSD